MTKIFDLVVCDHTAQPGKENSRDMTSVSARCVRSDGHVGKCGFPQRESGCCETALYGSIVRLRKIIKPEQDAGHFQVITDQNDPTTVTVTHVRSGLSLKTKSGRILT